MRPLAHLIGAALLGAAPVASATDFGPSIYAGMTARFDTATTPPYQNPEPELRVLLQSQKAYTTRNHFCMVGYRWPDGHSFASVHWREGGLIVRWHGGSDWADDYFEWYLNKAVNLQTGVIDADDSQGSTFLVTLRDANGTLEDCRLHGRLYVVEPFTPPPPPVEEED
ncbi:hypothetical protein [Pseudomonas sp. C11]|uniref:hypothetical protein n=1 Tax=Pseudomonas sp. C11 TaxID=3075550 RepID=UPI002AFF9BAA|nr:hypothetical protein [Pseudomonas sp. C11]